MKKKMVAMMLASMMALGLVGCGGSAEEPASKQESTEKEPEIKEEEASKVKKEESAEEAVEDDGIIDFTAETFNVKYVKHEFGTDYEGNKCLYYYYSFTNNGEENATAGIAAHVQCFQHGSDAKWQSQQKITMP